MQTYFGYFGHACSYSPKMIVSSWGRLRYLSACKIWTASFTFFLRYYILKNLAIWLAGSILAITRDPKFCQICWSNINHNISSRFRLFPRKTNITKCFKKDKNPYFGAILDPFCPNLGKYEFSCKKWLSRFFSIPIIYHCAKNQNNLTRHSRKNCWTDTTKICLFHWFLCEIQSVLESYDWLKNPTIMIGQEHFGPYPRNQNFPKYDIFSGI